MTAAAWSLVTICVAAFVASLAVVDWRELKRLRDLRRKRLKIERALERKSR